MRAQLIARLMAGLFALAAAPAVLHAQASRDEGFLVDVPASARPVIPAPPAPPPAAKPQPRIETVPAASVEPQPKPVPETKKESEPSAQPEPESGAKIVPLATDGRGPDESALRYYASLQQTRRVETEIKRLQRLYPDWRPPENIFNAPAAGAVDEQPFWDLFALDKMNELRGEIDKRMKKEPGWQPSPDLMDKIRRKESRLNITALWKAGKWKDIIAFVRGNTEAVGESTDVDILWTVAEAYAKTKQTADALNIYKSILKNNREPEQRLATVQKAMAVLRMSDVEELLAMAKKDSRGYSEFDGIAIDITRGRISAYLHDERQEQIPEAELRAFEHYAKEDKDPNQPGLVAWYYYKIRTFSQALEWFKHSISRGGDAMIAHGLAHSLRELGLYRETEEVAYAWREPLVNNAILFIDILERDLTKQVPPYIEPERLLRYAQVTMDGASGEGAQALAWYAYNACQFPTALEWFERAVAWLPKEATVYGYALTLQKLKKTKEFWDTINRYDGLFPKVIEIIYPDDYQHPPTPCDLVEGRAQQRQVQPTAPQYGFAVPSPYNAQPSAVAPYGAPRPAAMPGVAGYGGAPASPLTQQPGAPAPAAQAVAPVVPQPPFAQQQAAPPSYYATAQGAPGYYQNPDQVYRREPRIDRKLFPVSVDPQNPLRFYPTGRYMGPQSAAALQGMAMQSPLVNEPPMVMLQLVARRVPDVTRMPYERWGYALLPGYNGIAVPTGPHSSEKAPSGTLWTTLMARDAASTRGGAFDPIRNDVAALMQRMSSIPRVPPPTASINGPWTAPRPYKSREQLEAEGALQPANASAGATETPRALAPPALSMMPASAAAAAPAELPPRARELPPQATRPSAPAAPQPSNIVAPQAKAETNARDTLGKQAAEFYNRKQFVEALEALDRRLKTTPETTDLRLIRAWSLLNLNRVDEAKQVFGTLSGPARPRASAENANARSR